MVRFFKLNFQHSNKISGTMVELNTKNFFLLSVSTGFSYIKKKKHKSRIIKLKSTNIHEKIKNAFAKCIHKKKKNICSFILKL